MAKHNSKKIVILKSKPSAENAEDGIESEDLGITKPFDPTLIKIETKQMSLDTLIKRIRENEVSLSPDFQRNEVWKLPQKSRLIESLLIRIPLPAFYMDATDENEWLVVDGLQRLATIRDFVIDENMKLDELEFLSKFQGYAFKDLPRQYQRRIEETQVTVYQIEKGTPPEVKFNIFKRINTGGMPLSAQEIRHALNQGAATELLKKLVSLESFKKATNGLKDTRMGARECALRFIAFKLTPPEAYKVDTNFDTFLGDAMNRLNKMSENELNEIVKRFNRALTWSHDIFGKTAFRKPSAPINKALFEVYTIAVDNHTERNLHILKNAKDKATQMVNRLFTEDSVFLNAVSQGTSDIGKVQYRFKKFSDTLNGALND